MYKNLDIITANDFSVHIIGQHQQRDQSLLLSCTFVVGNDLRKKKRYLSIISSAEAHVWCGNVSVNQ